MPSPDKIETNQDELLFGPPIGSHSGRARRGWRGGEGDGRTRRPTGIPMYEEIPQERSPARCAGAFPRSFPRFCEAGRSRRGSLGVCEGSAGAQIGRSRSFLPPPSFPGGYRGWGCSPHRVRQGEEQRRGEKSAPYAFPRTKCFLHPKGRPPSCSHFGQTLAPTSLPPPPPLIGFFTPFSSSNFFFFSVLFLCVLLGGPWRERPSVLWAGVGRRPPPRPPRRARPRRRPDQTPLPSVFPHRVNTSPG